MKELYVLTTYDKIWIFPKLVQYRVNRETDKMYFVSRIEQTAGKNEGAYSQLRKDDDRIYLDRERALAAYIQAAQERLARLREMVQELNYQLSEAQDKLLQ